MEGFRLQIRFVETGLGGFDKEEKKVENGHMGGGGKLFQKLNRGERM